MNSRILALAFAGLAAGGSARVGTDFHERAAAIRDQLAERLEPGRGAATQHARESDAEIRRSATISNFQSTPRFPDFRWRTAITPKRRRISARSSSTRTSRTGRRRRTRRRRSIRRSDGDARDEGRREVGNDDAAVRQGRAVVFLYSCGANWPGTAAAAQTVYFGAPYEVRVEFAGTQMIKLGESSVEADRLNVSLKGTQVGHQFRSLFPQGRGPHTRTGAGPSGAGHVLDGTDEVKIAFFSPLPPAKSGIADYSAALLEELKRIAEVTAFSAKPAHFDPSQFDIALYQIGNNVYPRFLLRGRAGTSRRGGDPRGEPASPDRGHDDQARRLGRLSARSGIERRTGGAGACAEARADAGSGAGL